MKFFKILIVFAALSMMSACAKTSAIEVGSKAPDFSLTDLDGRPVSLSDFNGKVVILDFFATWCPPCREEIPDFINLEKAYAPQGFAMVGVSLVTRDEAKEFAAKVGINYPVLIDDGKASSAYGPIRSIPTTFVIGKDSMIKKIYIGYRPKEVFEGDVKELLK